ncbi:MAG: Mur ligase family protein [Actinomycetota bacterium]|nr:Mur ligase family protein [Actinomycetota bacterium]
MDLDGALAWLAGHVSLEADRSPAAAARRLDGIAQLVGVMGDPQHAAPVIHLTGTNGKGSTARIVTSLLKARGLSVGTYTSPHLERLNERMAWNGEPIPDADLADVLSAVADLEPLLDRRPTHFEVLTAAAFRWFADIAVDVAVVEVGLGGRWDATNVADGRVAVVTNVSLDHAETIGPALADIAREKAGIVKQGSTLVLGETDPELAAVFRGVGRAERVWERNRHFGCTSSRLAHGGRALDLFTPEAAYADVFLPAHGAFQAENGALALAATEAFFGAPAAAEVVEEGFAAVRLPGRLEVVGHEPLCILDGAHNPAGAEAAATAIDEAFGQVAGRILVVGMLAGRDPVEMLEAMRGGAARCVIACPPPSPRALPAPEVAAAARALGAQAVAVGSVAEAVEAALGEAHSDELVLVTGSLYVVGSARAWLRSQGLLAA